MQGRLVITLAEQDGRLQPGLILPPPMAAEAMLLGKTPDQAVDLLGRLFNLCRHAQEAAARLAFGLAPVEDASYRQEILRDCLFRLFIGLPAALTGAALPLPIGWQTDGQGLARAVFGPTGRPPESARTFWHWLKDDAGLAPILSALHRAFAPGEATSHLPPLSTSNSVPCENSVALRHLDHPVMRAIECDIGRGPLWRIFARLLDVQACLDGRLPIPRLIEPGLAEAPASRGVYRIRARTSSLGLVTEVSRRTPTDDLCHRGGALMIALAALSPLKRHLAPVVVECFDPCLPWHVQEVQDA